MHLTMFCSSFIVNGKLDRSDTDVVSDLEFERNGFYWTRWSHLFIAIMLLSAVVLKSQGFYMVSSMFKLIGGMSYVAFMILLTHLHDITFMKGEKQTEVS